MAAASVCATTATFAQNKVALVIGNNAYHRIAQLDNAVNDAVAVAEELRSHGFQVIRAIDVKAADIQAAKRRFIDAIANGGIGVFYFSGHGLQVEGRNFLLPVDFAGTSPAALGAEAVSVPALLDDIERAAPRLTVVILDACRNNPFQEAVPAQTRTRGLSEIARPVPTGTLILYAASSNQTALDAHPGQPSKNGLFTGELLTALRLPGLEIRDLAQKVRFSVMEKAQAVGHVQVPALYDNLSAGAFFFSSLRAPPPGRPPAAGLPARVTLIVPFAQGSPSDSVVRSIAPFLAKAIGREVIVENDIDVQGDRVAAAVANAPKDGSMLLISPFAASSRRLRANDARLVPVGIVADTPLSLVVGPRTAARTMPELLNSARAERRRVRMTVPLKGSPAEMCGQQVMRKFGGNIIELVSVNGEAAAVSEVNNGTADLTCAATAPVRRMAAQTNARIRELAEVRWSASPLLQKAQVAPAGPQGFDIVAPNWLGLFAPAGISPAAIQSLSAALGTMQQDPAYAAVLARLSALPVSADQATPQGLMSALRLGLALQN